MSFEREFSKNAYSYGHYNIIQKEVAKKLIDTIKEKKPKTILDLGCGSGELYKLVNWNIDKYVAVDISKNMCSLHPKEKNVMVVNANYEERSLYSDFLKYSKFDAILSSSSLQWARDLEATVKLFKDFGSEVAVSIFCSKTFDAIYKTCNLETFLPKYEKVIEIFERYYTLEHSREFYRLYFDDNISKFRYIKKSGVSGGVRKLSYTQTKKLIEDYPLDYLEFEVAFLYGKATSR